MVRDTVFDWMMAVLQLCGASFEQKADFLFNNSYDVKLLWDTVHTLLDPDVIC